MFPENKYYTRCVEALRDAPIFKALESQEVHTLLDHMTLIKWNKGISNTSTELNSVLHFIISGRIKGYQINVVNGREHTVFILSRGDVFDILNLLDHEKHTMYWETLDNLELLTIPVTDIRQMMDSSPSLSHSVLSYLGSRMRFLEDESNDICLRDTLSRLSGLLLKHFNEQSQKLEVINNLPNTEIANLIGTTRAVVNRNIQELKKAGAISVKRKQIDVENIEVLMAKAEGK